MVRIPGGLASVLHGRVLRREDFQCREDPTLDLIGGFGGVRLCHRHIREALFLFTGHAFQGGETKSCRVRFWEALPSSSSRDIRGYFT